MMGLIKGIQERRLGKLWWSLTPVVNSLTDTPQNTRKLFMASVLDACQQYVAGMLSPVLTLLHLPILFADPNGVNSSLLTCKGQNYTCKITLGLPRFPDLSPKYPFFPLKPFLLWRDTDLFLQMRSKYRGSFNLFHHVDVQEKRPGWVQQPLLICMKTKDFDHF